MKNHWILQNKRSSDKIKHSRDNKKRFINWTSSPITTRKSKHELFQTLTLVFNPFPNKPWFFTCLQYRSFENTVGKGEIARYEQFLLFPQCFLSFRTTFCHFYQLYKCRLRTLSIWKSLKFVVWERVNKTNKCKQYGRQPFRYQLHSFQACSWSKSKFQSKIKHILKKNSQ